jgi:hypothetical protein
MPFPTATRPVRRSPYPPTPLPGSWDSNFTIAKLPKIDVDIGAVALHTHDLQVASKRTRMDAAEWQSCVPACACMSIITSARARALSLSRAQPLACVRACAYACVLRKRCEKCEALALHPGHKTPHSRHVFADYGDRGVHAQEGRQATGRQPRSKRKDVYASKGSERDRGQSLP